MTEQLVLGDFAPHGFAVFSDCGKYRYVLGRVWNPKLPRDLWILLNPSKAGADFNDNDPTARKVMGFSQRYGAGSAVIVNPNALIATDPRELRAARKRKDDVTGPDNDRHIREQLVEANRVILGWGNNIDAKDKARVLALLGDVPTYALGLTGGDEPLHPLMVGYDRAIEPLRIEGA